MQKDRKSVIITGASSGIGRALAVVYYREGYALTLGARSMDKLKALAEELGADDDRILCLKTDVSNASDCKILVEACVHRFGGVDVLINNAGISMRAAFTEVKLSVLEQLMQVNFWGAVYCTKYAMEFLLERKGSVVGISSIAGYVGLPGRTGYSASKFAMHGFLEALRTENLKKGLHVLIACPGFTTSNIRNTALTATGSKQGESPRAEEKMMSAEQVAEQIFKAVALRKDRLVLTREGKMAVFLSKFLPKTIQKAVFNKMRKEPDSPLK